MDQTIIELSETFKTAGNRIKFSTNSFIIQLTYKSEPQPAMTNSLL